MLRLGPLCLLAFAVAFGGNGLDPRRSAADYPANLTTGKVSIGAAYISPAEARKIFGEDLDRHGWVVIEVGIFPADSTQVDVSPDDFKLRQGKDTSLARAASPHTVAEDIKPLSKSKTPTLPGNVHTVESIGYERGPNGRSGVYTGTEVYVGTRPNDPQAPTKTGNTSDDQFDLEVRLDNGALPETKTTKPVGGYIFFAKSTVDKHGDFELNYFGVDGVAKLKIARTVK